MMGDAVTAAAAWWARWLLVPAFTAAEAHRLAGAPEPDADDVVLAVSAVDACLVTAEQVEVFRAEVYRALCSDAPVVEPVGVIRAVASACGVAEAAGRALDAVTVTWRMRIAEDRVEVWIDPVTVRTPTGCPARPDRLVVWPAQPDTASRLAGMVAAAQWWPALSWADVLIGAARTPGRVPAPALTELPGPDQLAVAVLVAAAIRRAGWRNRLTARVSWLAVIGAGTLTMPDVLAELDPDRITATLTVAPPPDPAGPAWQRLTAAGSRRQHLVDLARAVVTDWIDRGNQHIRDHEQSATSGLLPPALLSPEPAAHTRPAHGAFLTRSK